MKEVKSPKRPLIYYYGIVLLVVFLFNLVVTPFLAQSQIVEVDYGTFMQMIEDEEIGQVQMTDSEILFTDKDETTVYKTGVMDDPNLTERLYASGATFTKEIEQTSSTFLNILLSFGVPILIFIVIGQYLNRRLTNQAGGRNAMQFGSMGKSNAKVYVQSTEGIHFSDVAGEDEAKESLAEIVDYLHNPDKYTEVGASMPKGLLLVGPRVPARPCWPRRWQARPTCHSSPSPAPNLWRCSWGWARPRSAICLSRQRKRRRVSCSSTKLTPLARSATPN